MTKKVADSKRWMLLGIEVSGKCLATLLGLGLDRLQRQTRGAVDRRFKAIWLQCVFAFLRRQVDLYLLKLYQEAAGMLPTKLLGSMHHSEIHFAIIAFIFCIERFP